MFVASFASQFPPHALMPLLRTYLLYAALNCCAVGLLLNPPQARKAQKNNSKWSWLNL